MNKKFEDVIKEQGKLLYSSEGDSMFPLIKPHDLLLIKPAKLPLKVGDVPLYKRSSGQYVLHRVVAVKRGRYVMKGDNRNLREKGITDKNIIGVLTNIIRDGKTYPVETTEEYVFRNAADLIYLLSCAVNGKTPDSGRIGKMDLTEICRLSRTHMLTSAAASALEQVIKLPHDFDQANKKAIRKIALFDIERKLITAELEKAKIWYLPLKGIVIKDYYPRSVMREMTDNDIFVDPARMQDVRTIMEGLGYTCDKFDHYSHDVYSKPPTLEFEMHHELIGDDEVVLFAKYYADLYSKTLPNDGGYERKLSDEDFYIFNICHAYKHYTHAGAGLRSLLDVYVFLRTHKELDRKYLDAEFKKLKVSHFEERMRRISNKLFTGAALGKEEREELKYFISSGSKGTMENRMRNKMAEELGGDDSDESKRRYLKKRVFISGKELEMHYPFVAKHKILYPFLLIYRPIKGALVRPKEIVKEYKDVKSFDKKEIKK